MSPLIMPLSDRPLVDQIAEAVLYEGYLLYPYRPSVKNRQRWTFGGLYPRAYSEANEGSDPWYLQAECLVLGTADTSIAVSIRFLHLVARTVEAFDQPADAWPDAFEAPRHVVESLGVGDETHYTWQEAEERKVDVGTWKLGEITAEPHRVPFAFEGGCERTPLQATEGPIVGIVSRERTRVEGEAEIFAQAVSDGVYRVRLTIRNTALFSADEIDRDFALMRSLVATHAVLRTADGAFVSLTDPPEAFKEEVADCRNVGAWPVLVGEEGATDTMLAAPIILYDYPRIAPESPGDLFDATEVDEILSLRIMTLTDDEKRAVAAVDRRARALLERTESLAQEQLMGLHGTMRGLHQAKEEADHD